MMYTVPTITKNSRPSHYKKAVAFCVDKAYLPYASFVANQILEKEKNRDFDVIICVPERDLLFPIPDSEIRYCSIDYSCMLNLPVGRLSMATYHKIFLPAIFKEEYEQILYLDADVYLNSSCISSLMSSYKENKGLAMAVDISEIERKSGLNFHNNYLNRYANLNHQYRNAGVILFNTKRLAEINYLEQLMNYAEKNKQKLLRHDQTLINTVLSNEISSLSFLFNYQLIDTTIPLLDEFKPKILHFVGELKPWNTEFGFIGSFHAEYDSFIRTHFPHHQLHSKSEFELKYESRKKKRKYKNPVREKLSLNVFVGKERLKGIIAYFSKPRNSETVEKRKIRRIISRFRASIDRSICESDVQPARS
ncbi:glycosyltransferase family 8 protein [Sphingobacterium tabacisoli]|uniref:Glycosyltransferase family 8 protein n=1 Tax=Sphingobacterium tabacisoli TaxID=2044855 RepID=A0ABW5KXU9_9SPHI|nr:glycosyltransferase [Sphingobacterium tabacisoli]